VADAAEKDFDLHVARGDRAARDGVDGEGGCGTDDGIGFGLGHGSVLLTGLVRVLRLWPASVSCFPGERVPLGLAAADDVKIIDGEINFKRSKVFVKARRLRVPGKALHAVQCDTIPVNPQRFRCERP
jgi:hypothetical protein